MLFARPHQAKQLVRRMNGHTIPCGTTRGLPEALDGTVGFGVTESLPISSQRIDPGWSVFWNSVRNAANPAATASQHSHGDVDPAPGLRNRTRFVDGKSKDIADAHAVQSATTETVPVRNISWGHLAWCPGDR